MENNSVKIFDLKWAKLESQFVRKNGHLHKIFTLISNSGERLITGAFVEYFLETTDSILDNFVDCIIPDDLGDIQDVAEFLQSEYDEDYERGTDLSAQADY